MLLHLIRRGGAVCAIAIATLALVLSNSATAQESVDDPAQVEAGEAIYATSCVGCHAETGVGTQNGPSLIGAAANRDRAAHIELVTMGGGGMPAFGSRHTPEEIEQVVSYVRLTFSEQPDAAAQADDDQDEEQLETLPMTGFEESLAFGGLALVVGGAALVFYAERRRCAPLKLPARYKQ